LNLTNPFASLFTKAKLFALLAMCISTLALGQAKSPSFVFEFDTLAVDIVEGEGINKLVKIINLDSAKPLVFRIDVNYPGEWKLLTNLERQYKLAPSDTFYIPISLVPLGSLIGNSKYIINAYLIDENETPIKGSFFIARKPKKIDWEISASPSGKQYLKNEQTEKQFAINLLNNGTENEAFTLNIECGRNDYGLITDTNGRLIKKQPFYLNLKPLADSTFHFNISLAPEMRNYRMVNLDKYGPMSMNEVRHYSIYANSQPTQFSNFRNQSKGTKINIVSVPNEICINDNPSDAFPLVMELNVSNALGNSPITSAVFRGNKILKNNAFLNYSAILFYGRGYGFFNTLSSSNINISYAYKKYLISLGNIRFGRGISGSYRLNKNNSFGASFGIGNNFRTRGSLTYGGWYRTRISRIFTANASYNRHAYFDGNSQTDLVNLNSTLRLPFNQTIGGSFNYVRNTNNSATDPVRSLFGFGLNYSISYLKGAARTTLNYSQNNNPINFQTPTSGSMQMAQHTSRYRMSKTWQFFMTNQLQFFNSTNAGLPSRTYLNNTLNVNGKLLGRTFSPAIFYNVFQSNQQNIHSRGINIGTALNKQNDDKIINLNARIGYNKNFSDSIPMNSFFSQTSLYYRYRVWSGFLMYSSGDVGFFSSSFNSSNNFEVSRTLMLSVNKQHQFKNKHFVLNFNGSYRYLSSLRRHTVAIGPQFNYLTNSKWRLFVMPQVFVAFNQQNPGFSGSESQAPPRFAASTNVNFGVRKAFSIRNPWSRVYHPTINYLAFLDHNGNNIRDDDEASLENVVIGLNETEVITDINGTAKVKNLSADSTYRLKALALEDVHGFFPKIPPTIRTEKDSTVNIPFVRGVKIYGKIYLNRDLARVDANGPLDLGGIRITAYNGVIIHTLTSYDGSFSMYVPYGEYVISMDESVVGSRFNLLQNDFDILLDNTTESVFVSFNLVEKRKKLNIKRFGAAKTEDGQEPFDTKRKKDDDDTGKVEKEAETNSSLGESLVKFTYPDQTIPKELAVLAYGENFEEVIDYGVVVGRFKDGLSDEQKNEMLSQVDAEGFSVDKDGNFTIIYKEFEDKAQGETFATSLRQKGFDTIEFLGKYDGIFINLGE
jgi:hypothetical protein